MEHGDVIDGKLYLSQTFTSKNDLIAELNDKYDFRGWLRVEPGVEEAIESNDELFDFLLDDDIIDVNNDATGENIVIQIQPFTKPYWLKPAGAARRAARAAKRVPNHT